MFFKTPECSYIGREGALWRVYGPDTPSIQKVYCKIKTFQTLYNEIESQFGIVVKGTELDTWRLWVLVLLLDKANKMRYVCISRVISVFLISLPKYYYKSLVEIRGEFKYFRNLDSFGWINLQESLLQLISLDVFLFCRDIQGTLFSNQPFPRRQRLWSR